MNKQNRFIKHLIKYGESATITSITGTTCPCWTWRGTGYSPQYHDEYPATENCNGTGKIGRTTTTINIKAIFYPPMVSSAVMSFPDSIKTAIGEIGDIDLIMMGTIDSDNYDYESLASYTQADDYVTYNSIAYRISKVIPYIYYEYILLKRKTT